MAIRKNKTKSKTTAKTSKTPPARSSRARSTASRPATKSTISRTIKAEKPAAEKAARLPLTLEQKMNLVGLVLLMLGLVSLLALLQKSAGTATQPVSNFLVRTFGWPAYLIPIFFIGAGAWFVLSNLRQFPAITADRVIGLVLFFFNLVAWAEAMPTWLKTPDSPGGGLIGKAIGKNLITGLGNAAAWIVLIFWLLVSLIFLAHLSMSEIIYWLAGRMRHDRSKLADWVRARAAERNEASGNQVPESTYAFEPVDVTKGADQTVAQVQTQKPASSDQVTPSFESAIKSDHSEAMSAPLQTVNSGPNWVLPKAEEILDPVPPQIEGDESDMDRARVIEETLRSFSTPAHVVEIRRGPSVTMFGVEPDYLETSKGKTRVRVSNITRLADDLAMALKASQIRMQAPVPGKGYIGVEVPNQKTSVVSLLEVIESNSFVKHKSPLKFALGKDVSGQPVTADLAAMPHLLIAGTTGSGKSVCVNAILAGYLLTLKPDELRIVLVDPKRVELTGYNGIPHLLAPVIVDAEKVVGALQWMLREMDLRYRNFAGKSARNIVEYNQKLAAEGAKKLPYILVVIDELADLMMLAPDETEKCLARLAQLARATGIHLILATQRPSTDILTGLIKANFPARIAFAVASGVDSRVILDQPGAERLLGRGDMLFQAPDSPAPIRLQGTYLSDAEINRLTDYWRSQASKLNIDQRPDTAVFTEAAITPLRPPEAGSQTPLWQEMEKDPNEDPIKKEALLIIRKEGRASVSMLQRKLRIGYTRASRLMEELQKEGIVGQPDPQTGTREVLDYGDFPPIKED